MIKTLACLMVAALLAGCGTTAASIGYSPTEAATPAAAPGVSSVTVTDAREEPDPTYIGAIRGGSGNPLKTFASARPVKEEVALAFQQAMRSRGLLGPAGGTTMDVRLIELSGNQAVRREGHTTFSLSLTDRATGQRIYEDRQDVLKITGSILALDVGIFGSIDLLRSVVALSLSTAIDQALDKPGFQAALH